MRFGLEYIRCKISLARTNDKNIRWKRIVAIPRIELRHGAAPTPNHTECGLNEDAAALPWYNLKGGKISSCSPSDSGSRRRDPIIRRRIFS